MCCGTHIISPTSPSHFPVLNIENWYIVARVEGQVPPYEIRHLCSTPNSSHLSADVDIQSVLSVTAQLSQQLQDNGHSQLTLHCSAQVHVH